MSPKGQDYPPFLSSTKARLVHETLARSVDAPRRPGRSSLVPAE
jgi:hypothetical protein